MEKIESRLIVMRSARSITEFTEQALKLPEVKALLRSIDSINKQFGDIYFPKKSKLTEKLTSTEQIWSEYFESHSFSGANEVRNLADAITILTGTDVNRFIKVTRPSGVKFVAGLCIVPIKNPNGHNYAIGEPILNLSGDAGFFRKDGTSGNSMSDTLTSFRMASTGESQEFVFEFLYAARSDCLRYLFSDIDAVLPENLEETDFDPDDEQEHDPGWDEEEV
jgi:hypothetical protein